MFIIFIDVFLITIFLYFIFFKWIFKENFVLYLALGVTIVGLAVFKMRQSDKLLDNNSYQDAMLPKGGYHYLSDEEVETYTDFAIYLTLFEPLWSPYYYKLTEDRIKNEGETYLIKLTYNKYKKECLRLNDWDSSDCATYVGSAKKLRLVKEVKTIVYKFVDSASGRKRCDRMNKLAGFLTSNNERRFAYDFLKLINKDNSCSNALLKLARITYNEDERVQILKDFCMKNSATCSLLGTYYENKKQKRKQ